MLLDVLLEVTGISYSGTSCISECPQIIIKIHGMLTFWGIYKSGSLRGGMMCGDFVQLASPAGMVSWRDNFKLATGKPAMGMPVCGVSASWSPVGMVSLSISILEAAVMSGSLRGGIGFGWPRTYDRFTQLGSPAGKVVWRHNPPADRKSVV